MDSAADTLKRWREQAKLTQADLAAMVHVTEGAVSQWETGRTSPRFAVAVQIDDALGAGSEILTAFGYAAPGSPDRLATIIQQLAEEPSRGELAKRLTQLTTEIRRMGKTLITVSEAVVSVQNTVKRVQDTTEQVQTTCEKVDSVLAHAKSSR